MKTFSIAEQVASHLREELLQERWKGVMPGRDRLARELGVHGSTVERALQQLEDEGLLKSGGVGKRRKITVSKTKSPSTRVVVVLYEPEDVLSNYIIELQHQLHSAGHRLSFASKTLTELKHDPKRVMKMMKDHPAEGWIVVAGAAPLLKAFSKASTPSFGMFGNMTNLQIAGTGAEKLDAIRDCIDHLYEKGCRRIVMIVRNEKIKTGNSPTEQTFLEALEKKNLAHGSYNLPEWENTPSGLHQCLNGLFQLTPPDAILLDDWMLYLAIQNFLSRGEGLAFRRTICVTMDYHPSYKWCEPIVPHFYWEASAIIRHIVTWVDQLAKGKNAKKVNLVQAKFIPGG